MCGTEQTHTASPRPLTKFESRELLQFVRNNATEEDWATFEPLIIECSDD